jgi:hypothetical protein
MPAEKPVPDPAGDTSLAFTMADLAVHDDRSTRSRWSDLRVHDGPKFAAFRVAAFFRPRGKSPGALGDDKRKAHQHHSRRTSSLPPALTQASSLTG